MAFHTPGGGEVQLLAYKKHLPTFGVDVSLFDPWNPRFLEHDIVHFYSCVGGSSHFCAFVKQLGLPLVVSSSLWITEQTKDHYPLSEIRAQLSLADRVITNSNMECETLSKVLELPREKFVTVYNGVEEDFFFRVDPNLFCEQFGIKGRFILNVGNIEPRKNQLRLAEAMEAFPDVQLILIGHARTPEYLEQVLQMGGKQVSYLGPLDHNSPLLRSAYSACDGFALPSTLETPGLAALEAGAQGASLVLTREGSTTEYFEKNAIFVDPLSSESIRQGIDRALTECPGTRDHNLARKYAWSNTIRSLVDTYQAMSSIVQ
jgi:glycosyltransferase involved in cell wall biosynthesis